MKACVIESHGGPEVLKWVDAPTPKPGPGEVLIRLHAASINHLDVWVRNGIPAYSVKLPHIPGSDGAGTVADLGEGAKAFSVGDRVFIAPGLSCGSCEFCASGRDNQCTSYSILGAKRPGTYGEFVSIPATNAWRLPERLTFEEGAAFPLTFLTAWHMLFGRAGLKPGQTLLIVGVNSGVGVAALELAKHMGARVIATASSPEKCAKAKGAGADEAVNHREPGLAKKVRDLTGGRGVDVALEHIGPDTWGESVRSLAPCGSVVTCGATSGPEVTMDLRWLFSRDLSIHGSRMGTRGELSEIVRLLGQGELRILIDRTFPAEEGSKAHRYLEERRHFGKIVLKHKV